MSRPLLVRSALALVLFIAADVHAATDADLAEIREQIRQLKESYEARIQALEQRLKAAEARPAEAASNATPTAPVAAPVVAAAPAASAPAGVPPASSAGISAFNPAISAVLQGVYANYSQNPDHYAIAGFVPSGDILPAKRGSRSRSPS